MTAQATLTEMIKALVEGDDLAQLAIADWLEEHGKDATVLREHGRAVAFFYTHGGCSYDPAKESPEEGKLRCAMEYAEAERWAQDEEVEIEWSEDDYYDREGIDHDRPLYNCLLTYEPKDDDILFKGLCGIDLGPHGDLRDPYVRVVEAELAEELMRESKEKSDERHLPLSAQGISVGILHEETSRGTGRKGQRS